MGRFDTRLIVALGLCVFAGSCLMNTQMSVDYAGDQLLVPNIVRAVGQAVVLAPLTALAMAGIGREEAAAASGIFNMLRNLGGAVGTALLATIVTKREQYHSNIVGQSVSLFEPATRQRLEQLTAYFQAHGISDPAAAKAEAVVAIGRIVRQQSLVMAYSDSFAVLGVVLLVAAGFVMLTRKPAPGAGGAGAH